MDKKIIEKVFQLAEKSLQNDEFPVGAIIYDENGIISCGYNKRNSSKRTTDHAEIIAIQKANKKLSEWRLENKCMVVTLEPCDMCKAVIREARLKEVYYLIPRYQYKRQYKCTLFKNLPYESKAKEKYTKDITEFFTHKR